MCVVRSCCRESGQGDQAGEPAVALVAVRAAVWLLLQVHRTHVQLEPWRSRGGIIAMRTCKGPLVGVLAAGASVRPIPLRYSLAREAQDALDLLDQLGLDQAAILGTSRGGLIAMSLAATAALL